MYKSKMFKAGRWKNEKNKIKAVFKFQFKATRIDRLEFEEFRVFLIPVDTGKITARSEKVAVVDGSCKWEKPIYEAVSLIRDSKTGKFNGKSYHFVVSNTGSVKSGVLGEIGIDLADYVESFKPCFVSLPLKVLNAETVLHVTLQRMEGEVEERGLDGDGDRSMNQEERRTLRSQLGDSRIEEGKLLAKIADDDIKPTEVSYDGNPAKTQFPSARIMSVQVKSNGNLRKSYSLDTISASSSDSSSERYTPKQNGDKNNNITLTQQEYGNILSPVSSADTPRDTIMTSGNDWSVISAPYGSIDGSSSSSGEALLRQGSQESDNNIVEKLSSDVIVLTRQLEVSKMELQTLRKQVIKESRRGQDLWRELKSMKEGKFEVERECLELKASIKKAIDTEKWSLLEETKQELNHEKILNANLCLQLKKTNESNNELILLVRDLEELLEKKNKDSRFPQSLETSTYENDEQNALVVLVNQPSDVEVLNLADHKIAHLTTELELYKKEREEIEMQMEQLALDYEILKQENHDISKKLEQVQLREQLRMQFDCSAHFASISELEVQVESLENEIERLTEEFHADLENISSDKIEEEKRAIKAEEALKKLRLFNCSAAEQIQLEFKRFTEQMSSAFYMNEKLVVQTLKESSELQLQKCHLDEVLEKTNKELDLVKHQHHVKSQQLLSLINFKTKQVDSLVLELKEKHKEIEGLSTAEEARRRASSEQIAQLTSEVEMISRKQESAKATISESNMLLQESKKERSLLEEELSFLNEEAKKSLHELNDLRKLKFENEATIRNLREQVGLLSDDLQKEADFIAIIDKKAKDHNTKLINIEPPINSSTRCKISLHENTLLLENARSNGDCVRNHIMEDKKKLKDLNNIGTELIISNCNTNPEIEEERSILCSCEQQKNAQVLLEMEGLKEQNQMMEIELKEMQEMYSEMSLKFAEVEGERQKLVIKIRSLKNSLKVV